MATATQQVQGMVPPAIIKAFIADFGGKAPAAAEYAGIPVSAINRAEAGTLIHAGDHEALWRACRRRLGNVAVNKLLNPPALNAVMANVAGVPTPITILDTQRCVTCKGEFPATLEYFAANPHNRSGRQPWCRPCHAKHAKAAQEKAALAAKNKREAAKAATTPETVAASEPANAPSPKLGLSAALLQLATDAEALEAQLAATVMYATTARIVELEQAGAQAAKEVAALMRQVEELTAELALANTENERLWQRLETIAAQATMKW